MFINFGSNSWKNADEKAYRLSPEMFKPLIKCRNGEIFFTVRVNGSRNQKYHVILHRDFGASWQSHCDCAAGVREMACYHAAAAYQEYSRLVSGGYLWTITALPHFIGNEYQV